MKKAHSDREREMKQERERKWKKWRDKMEKMERENGPGPSRPGLRQALNCLQGRNEGDKGGTIPWAQNHCGGRGMTARGTKKFQ